jgi:chromosome partitioning protein
MPDDDQPTPLRVDRQPERRYCKTSTSISLAAGLARKGKKVLLIDIDSQANSSKVLLRHYPEIPEEETIYSTVLDRKGLVVHPTHVPNLSIVR